MPRTKLLWTERPRILQRERETHAWMLEHRPWDRFDLELVHAASPGGWVEYSRVFLELWDRCASEGVGFINLESDVVPTLEAFKALLACPEPACLVPYRRWDSQRWGAWHPPTALDPESGPQVEEGDRWAYLGDLGFCRFSPAACARPLLPSARLTKQNGLLNHEVWRSLGNRIHLHWPGLITSHVTWDEGDDEHWPDGGGRLATPEMLEALFDNSYPPLVLNA